MNDDFDKLFPRTASHFSASTVSADAWARAAENDGLIVTGQYLLLAEDLLKRCESWRQRVNLFSAPNFSLTFTRFREAHAIMTKQSFNRAQPQPKAQFRGFLEYRLTDDQLAELDEWQPSAMDVFAYCDKLLTGGIKISLSYNERTKLATCSLMDERKKLSDGEPNPAGGYMLSTSDTSCSLALKAGIYKHFMALEASWTALIDRPSQGGRRG